jgi:hypothetical protein
MESGPPFWFDHGHFGLLLGEKEASPCKGALTGSSTCSESRDLTKPGWGSVPSYTYLIQYWIKSCSQWTYVLSRSGLYLPLSAVEFFFFFFLTIRKPSSFDQWPGFPR